MVNDRELILASTSPFRKKQLEELEIPFKAIAPGFDEETFKDQESSPQELVQLLAKGKAESLRNKYPNAIILGSDQLVVFKGKILGKGGSPEAATEQLLNLSGKSHKLLTAMCLITPEKVFEHIDISEVQLRSLNSEQAKNYVEKNETWHCAGSYKIECQPALVIEKLNTQDPTSILGLPTFSLLTWLYDINYIQQ